MSEQQPERDTVEPAEVTSAAARPGGERGAEGNVPVTGLADGEWHRLHPATPLLRGGIALVAIIGVVIANMRERLFQLFFHTPGYGPEEGDPIEFLIEQNLIGLASIVVLAFVALLIGGFFLSWRFHSFRITEEVVEVRSGIVFRTNRKARLDRIQGINLSRPLFARIFGAAKLEVTQAGHDANVQLAYLASRQADDLRREVLRLASGARAEAQEAARGATGRGSLIERRVSELLAPELDEREVRAHSVVHLHPGRLAGSILLSETMVVFLALAIVVVVVAWTSGQPLILFGFFPGLIALGAFLVSRFTKSLRYSIADTPDGVRVGFGLLSTTNDTLPPGRIHSVQVSQSILWRPAGWWQIKVNRASRSGSANQQEQRSVILPVGDIDDVLRVLALILPGIDHEQLLREGLVSKGGEDSFTNSPRRAAALRWFSWRRNGFALIPDAVVLRRGAIWRELVIVPQPRMQSVSVRQGPLLRALDLASVHAHTVAGPITARLGAVDRAIAIGLFERLAQAAVESARNDRSHRWRSGESTA